ncbi:hypothetical protein ACFQ0F_06050 [Paraperlucidibaca wandonensis]|uniref:Uncharacterized protein n=1 Tax=Paraperlucidibaca wandonensis TaxID=1268273 RepID=A0ABW3HHG9_9GAMM
MFNKKYGNDLAEKVANHLEMIGPINNNHRDYCGTGFIFLNGNYIYTHFQDGEADLNNEINVPDKSSRGIVISFDSKIDFISWLSLQTDKTLSSAESSDDWYNNNQRITKERLLNALANKNT